MGLSEETGVSGLDFEAVLPESLTAEFMARASRVHARKGQMIIAQGSDATDVYLIISGRVSISVFSANGRETILREMGPGRLLGEMAGISDLPRSACAVVIDDAVFGIVPASAFRAMLQDVPGAGLWMATQLAARVRNLTEKSSELASLPLSARLQSEVLRLCVEGKRDGDRCEVANLPTHADLAARIGTSRETVTREFRQMASEGLISQSGRTLVVPSLTRLTASLARLSG